MGCCLQRVLYRMKALICKCIAFKDAMKYIMSELGEKFLHHLFYRIQVISGWQDQRFFLHFLLYHYRMATNVFCVL